MKSFFAISCLALFLAALACNDSSSDPIDENPPVADETFESFLEHFAREYSERDSAGYAAYLDSAYLFELLPEEVDPGMPSPWWDRQEELLIAGNMFEERYQEDGIKVQSIDLDLTLKTAVEDQTPYEGKPEGEVWYKVTAHIDLRVIAEDPNASDGSGITHFIVSSDQHFVVRRDPGGSGRYLVYKQTDVYTFGKSDEITDRTERTSWGAVKSLWR